MKLKSFFNSFAFLMALLIMAFSPPDIKAQALVTFDTLKTLDSVLIVSVAPYGDDVTFTILDSSDSKIDTVKVYEILPAGRFDSVGVDATLEGAKFDSMVVNTTFIPGDNTSKTYVLRNRQPWKLKFVRTNANSYSPKTYIIVRARTRFLNNNLKLKPDGPGYASSGMKNIILIEDKFGMLKINYKESAVLLAPWVTKAIRKHKH